MTRDRDEIELLLPFQANGTLSPEDEAELAEWLARDADLAEEAEALAAIRADMQAEPVQSPGEFGLARLMREVARDEATGTNPPPLAQARHRPWLWQAAAVVAMTAFLGQTIVTWDRSQGGFEFSQDGREFSMASGANGVVMSRPPSEAVFASGLIVAFVPSATEAEIRDLLLSLDLEIVSGPSSLGLYQVAGTDIAAARVALAAAPQIVESVENAND